MDLIYRVIKLGSKVYGIQIDIDDDFDNIKEFIDSGDVVLLTSELYLVAELLNIDEDDIEIVEPEKDEANDNETTQDN